MTETPFLRFRHNRTDEATRSTFRETTLCVNDFIWPVFLKAGANIQEEIPSMPGVFRFSINTLLSYLEPLVEKGLSSVLLFGIPDEKGINQAWDSNGIVQKAIPLIKARFKNLVIITDVCICSYSHDGHCHTGNNDETCDILARIALSHAKAGASAIAPSDMMDGRVLVIRKILNEHGFTSLPIISYAAKFASNFYGPFRSAAKCSPQSGDRKTYQMDYANGKEALLEIAADINEEAQSIIIKPALCYLDVVARAADTFNVPIIGYNVSGEYSMLLLAIKNGIARKEIIHESLVSIKRAGASQIISYFAPMYILDYF